MVFKMKPKLSLIIILITILVISSSPSLASGQPILEGQTGDADGPPYYYYLPILFNNHMTCSAIPTLLAPANGSTLNTLIPLFRWDLGSDPSTTTSRIEVATDSGMEDWIWALTTYQTMGIAEYRDSDNFDPARTYYWRGRLNCGETQGPYTETWSFTTGSGGVIPPAPNLIAPANGSTIPSLDTVFQWSAVSGATEYRLSWRELGDTGYSDTSVTGTQNQLYGLAVSTTYEWWVTAVNNYAVGLDSAIWQFTTPAGTPSGLLKALNPWFSVAGDGNSIINEYWR
jgi:hypothetical protein